MENEGLLPLLRDLKFGKWEDERGLLMQQTEVKVSASMDDDRVNLAMWDYCYFIDKKMRWEE